MKLLKKYHRDLLFLIFISFWPAINFTSINLKENLISPTIYFLSILIFFLAILIFSLLKLVLKNQNALIITSIGIVVFFLFGGFETLSISLRGTIDASAKIAFITCSLLFFALSAILINLSNRNNYVIVLSVFLFALYSPSAIRLVYSFFQDSEVVINEEIETISSIDEYRFKNLHNVYFIILDAYARQDVLKDVFDFDNSKFLENLKQRGFITSTNSFSNYNRTGLSISTAFNMDYYTMINEYNNYLIISDSKTLQTFNLNNYEYAFIQSGGNTEISCSGKENYCVKSGNFGDDVALFLKMTPIWRVMTTQAFNLYRYFESLYVLTDVDHAIEMVVNKYKDQNKNYFAFAHILSPHEPQRFNKDCSKYFNIDPQLGMGSFDQYLTDLPCLNNQVINTIDFILKNDQSDPIILIQSDHGVANILKGLNHDDKLLKLKNFMTFKLPNHCKDNYYDEISLVNTMSLTFSCLTGNKPVFVKDRYFYAGYGVRDLVEVTDKLVK